MFITLEGPEGAGKSTQLPLLARWLEQQGREVVLTRNPGGTAVGAEIRRLVLDPAHTNLRPLCELLLYAADRAQHVEEVVRPNLAAGRVVLCDRFGDSTLAYQGYGRGLDRATIAVLQAAATGGLEPDLTLVLDLPVEVGLERAQRVRSADRLEHEAVAFHRRVRDGYLAIAAAHPTRVRVIDALGSPDDVQAAIRAAVYNAGVRPREEP